MAEIFKVKSLVKLEFTIYIKSKDTYTKLVDESL